MQVLSSIAAVREARAAVGATLGFVPTMGFLHEGHLSLVRRAKTECGAVAVSIFINPTQFAPGEDLDRYPRALERDLDLLRGAGAAFVFTPQAAEMYPPGFATSIDVGPVARPLEGAVRPGHFSGVATVVTKLFNIVQPTRAYFGQKDGQQCAVIRRLVTDLNMPLEVMVCDTVRSESGLALSSRNSYLGAEERERAVLLHESLRAAQARVAAGERDASVVREVVRSVLAREPAFAVDYVSVADPLELNELEWIGDEALVSLAVRVGATRLIDNMVVRPGMN
ncbi:pantoate--beta-alanine ligase [Acetobacter sp. LMG 1627]|uniref:Pantothenate synthetase n=2 Tax=Acetobacter conturbans TaxID=1737472 RepID=A0ABX0JUT8_9PROT|nr:pantoate--beta-alanine ligase [Acetobacter conturbans]